MKIVQLYNALHETNNYKFCILGNFAILDHTTQLTRLWEFEYVQKGTYNTIGDLIK